MNEKSWAEKELDRILKEVYGKGSKSFQKSDAIWL